MTTNVDLEEFSFQEIKSRLPVIVRDVRNKRLDLVNFVEELGSHLTSTDVQMRGYGVGLLSDVLYQIVGYPMQGKEVTLFVDFFGDRLKDHYSVIPVALLGTLALVTNQTIFDAHAVKIVQTVFREVHIQSLPKEGRLTAYYLFEVLLEKHLNALKETANDFVFGFIQAIDGEKDPRNLSLVFWLVRVIITNFPIDLFVEDLFEVTSCYFPIDLSPTSDDASGVKKDDLVLSLRKCLAATNKFASFCLPLLMEKLSSDIVDVKIDSLLTMSACLEVYQGNYLLQYLDELWTSVKTDFFHSVNLELEEASLSAVTSIVRNLSCSLEEHYQEEYEQFLKKIQAVCVYFSGSDIRMAKLCARLLQATAVATESTCHRVINFTFPCLLEVLKENIGAKLKQILISVIGDLVKTARIVCKTIEGTPLMKFKESVQGTLVSLLSDNDPSLYCAAVDGLMMLLDIRGLMQNEEVELLVQHLNSILLSDREVSVSEVSMASLSQLSSRYPNVVISLSLPALFMWLKKEEGSVRNIGSSEPSSCAAVHYQGVLDALCAVCTEESVIRQVIPHIIEHIRNLWKGNTVKATQSVAKDVFRCLLHIIEGSIQAGLVSAAYFKQSVLPLVMQMVLISASNDSCDGEIMRDAEILENVAAILRTVTCDLEIESAQSLQEEFSKLFLGKKSIYSASLQRRPFSPLQILSPWQQTQLVSLLTATLCSARQKVVIPWISELLPSLLSLACQSEHERTIVSGAQCLAGIINKIPEGDQLTEVLNDFISRIWQISDEEGSLRKATIIWLWLTKALVLRTHPLADRFIEKILNLLEDRTVGHLTAEGFYIIMADFEEVMTIKTHVNYKLMYRQRFFMETAPKLMKGFQSTKSDFKYNYLLGLSHLLEWIPRQVLLSEVSNLMVLLVQSLSFDEQKLQLSTLRTVNSLILDAPEVVTRNITSIVPILLGLSKYEPVMKIRSEALRCLGALTTLPHHAVYPYKAEVCRALAYSVDDKKRLVRKEAVNCRNAWYLLCRSAR